MVRVYVHEHGNGYRLLTEWVDENASAKQGRD